MNPLSIDYLKQAREKALAAGAKCARENIRLNALHYFDLPNSIAPSIDLDLQEWALKGYQAERARIHQNQIELKL